MYKRTTKRTATSETVIDSRDLAETEIGLASTSSANASWISDSDWVITSQTPDSLFAITPPGGEGQVWVQVAAAQARANQKSKHSNNESSVADSSSSSAATSPVLVEAQPAIPLLSKTNVDNPTPVALASESSATAPLARTLEAQIEADLVASVAELLASAVSTEQDLSSTKHTAPIVVSRVESTSETRSSLSVASGQVDAMLSSPSSVLLQVNGGSGAQSTMIPEVSPTIHLSPTLRPLSSVCTPPVFGTLTDTLRSALAMHRSQISTFPQAAWPTTHYSQADSIAFRTDTQSMWTTPPSTEVDVQLVEGTAEMEALMASSPEIPSASLPPHRYDRKDKLASRISNNASPNQEAIVCNQVELAYTSTEDTSNDSKTSPVKATTPNTLNVVTDRHQSSTNATATATATISTHKRHLHHHQHRRHASTNHSIGNEKSLRRIGHASTSNNTKRKPFYIRYW
ncbi:hypothetical protein BDF22DRAFT_700309 [Syncephalis plumigaleata]|nr:hypothetical protein BDF22DRAFT_700309 [Syncephalis plumigaleata]